MIIFLQKLHKQKQQSRDNFLQPNLTKWPFWSNTNQKNMKVVTDLLKNMIAIINDFF